MKKVGDKVSVFKIALLLKRVKFLINELELKRTCKVRRCRNLKPLTYVDRDRFFSSRLVRLKDTNEIHSFLVLDWLKLTGRACAASGGVFGSGKCRQFSLRRSLKVFDLGVDAKLLGLDR